MADEKLVLTSEEHTGVFRRRRDGSYGELTREERDSLDRKMHVELIAEAMVVLDSNAFGDVQMAWLTLFPDMSVEVAARSLAKADTSQLGRNLRYAAKYFTVEHIRHKCDILTEWARLLEEREHPIITNDED